MRSFINNIELYLSGAGLIVIWLVPSFLPTQTADFWHIAAITAIGVGVLHGMIFWIVRRRQRQVRNQTIQEISRMLEDVINNQLMLILLHSDTDGQPNDEQFQELNGIKKSVDKIASSLKMLSEESLYVWQEKYQHIPETMLKTKS